MSVKFAYKKEWGDIPFYHEEPVSSSTFKGFMGDSYHTRHVISLSWEYLTSMLREFIYLGIYADGTVFKGSGYDLTGTRRGIAGGRHLKRWCWTISRSISISGKTFSWGAERADTTSPSPSIKSGRALRIHPGSGSPSPE